MFEIFKKESGDSSTGNPLGGMGMGDVITAAKGLGAFIVEMKQRLLDIQSDLSEIKSHLNIKKDEADDGNNG